MSLLNRVQRAAGNTMTNLFGANGSAHSARIAVSYHDMAVDLETHYQALRLYKHNNRLYHELAIALREQGVKKEAMSGIRNPTNAATEFYPAVIWPGSLPEALPIRMRETGARADNRKARIQQVWQWSNWGVNKQVFARNLPTLGDQFTKVVTRRDADGEPNRVFFRTIEPEYVIDFDTDERGFIEYIRVDIPRMRRQGDEVDRYTHIEVWDKATGLYRRWEHRRDDGDKDLDQLGTPIEEESIVDLTGDDFIPFVHTKFIDDGRQRGTALIMPALDKIDELNRMATRLHQLMFRHGSPDKQLVGVGTDPDGLPIPPPKFKDDVNINAQNEGGPVTVGDETFWKLPSGWRIENIIANLPYMAHIEEIRDSMLDLTLTDLPELKFGRVSEASNLSGRAIRLMMTDALSRAVEVRGNAETSLVRLNQMALSIAQNAGIAGFSAGEIGTFAGGDFEHAFEERNILPTDELEDAQTAYTWSQSNVLRAQYAFSEGLLKLEGRTDEEIARIQADQLGSAPTLDESGQAPANAERGFTG